MSSEERKPFLNVRETAMVLNVHENTIRNWVKSGTIVSSRVPGSTTHRFAHDEVQRLLHQSGQATSSVAPILRVDEPELVTASELDRWASRADSKGTFPDLIRRLLASTAGITNLNVRAHEGVAAHGWDGTATSSGSAFLPAGELRFEFGTNADPKTKAQKDYDNRVNELPGDEKSTVVFMTPRNWPGGKKWASDRVKEKKFAGVEAFDAHRLEGWLRDVPSVHHWISERLGYLPRDVQTLERWWSDFQSRTTVPLPSAFFGAGRGSEAKSFRDLLRADAQTGEATTVQAPWKDDALAFIYNSLSDQVDTLHRVFLVSGEAAWGRLVDSTTPLVLIPVFSEPFNFQPAVSRGHRVVLLADGNDAVRNGKIFLPKIDHVEAREALKPIESDSSKASSMVALGRRSMPALVRSIAREPRLKAPEWAVDATLVSMIAPLALATSWGNLEGDQRAMEKLAGRSRTEIDQLLTTLSHRPDAPFTRSGGLWRLTSPAEAALLLLPRLGAGDLQRWSRIVAKVLLEPDPFEGMDTMARLTASIAGSVSTYSGTLRKGLAQGLALAGASDAEPWGQSIQRSVNSIVHELLQAANADSTGATWARLSLVMPDLAEASPEIFLDAVDADLGGGTPVITTMYKDSGADFLFGESASYPHLLRALEGLCWSPLYFGRAAGLLAQLAALDIGGQRRNPSVASLQKITTGWISQTGASVDEKLAVIDRIFRRFPEVGWEVAIGVWPSHHAVAFPPHQPAFRDWAPDRGGATSGWPRFVHELMILVADAAGTDSGRWNEVIPHIDELPSADRLELIEKLDDAVKAGSWSSDEAHAVWETLSDELDRHEEYADAAWAMPASDVALLREIATRLKPSNDPRRFSSLFDWRVRVASLGFGDDGYDAEVERLRGEALDVVVSTGSPELARLVSDVKTPHIVGYILAERADAPESDIMGWLAAGNDNLRRAALAFADGRIRSEGLDWLSAALISPELELTSAKEALMGAVPFAREFWTEISTLEVRLQSAYWQSVAPYGVPTEDREEAVQLLLDHERRWAAVTLLSDALQRDPNLDVGLIKRALDAMLQGVEPMNDQTMSSYYVGTLLDDLELRAPNDEDLPKYEFYFFELLHDHHPSTALYRSLGSASADFVDLVSAVYRGEDEPKRTLDAHGSAFANLAWSVLREWKTLPGLRDDGTIDVSHLNEWVRSARLALSDAGRSAIGDEQIGQILASSPVGADGAWPAEPVRELVENIGNARIDAGLAIGKTNQRGVTSRGVFDGGAQERVLVAHYQEMAAKIATKWPRTARILRGIAEDYSRDARRNDADAERRGDRG